MTTPFDAERIAEVAKGLTKAQREAMSSYIDRRAGYATTGRTAVTGELSRLGLASTWGVSSSRLTRIGLAVRQHLLDTGR